MVSVRGALDIFFHGSPPFLRGVREGGKRAGLGDQVGALLSGVRREFRQRSLPWIICVWGTLRKFRQVYPLLPISVIEGERYQA